MPLYEYRCLECKNRCTILVLSLANAPAPHCRHCQSPKVERLLSRFASPKSEEARLESLADPDNLSGLDENDPESMARFMKKMGEEMGEDVGDEIDQAMESGDPGLSESAGTDSL
jgi:putative FmdB family regulatory protein